MSVEIEGIRLVTVAYRRGATAGVLHWKPVAERYITIESLLGPLAKENAISACKEGIENLVTLTYQQADAAREISDEEFRVLQQEHRDRMNDRD